jgi:hypothetical protein
MIRERKREEKRGIITTLDWLIALHAIDVVEDEGRRAREVKRHENT